MVETYGPDHQHITLEKIILQGENKRASCIDAKTLMLAFAQMFNLSETLEALHVHTGFDNLDILLRSQETLKKS